MIARGLSAVVLVGLALLLAGQQQRQWALRSRVAQVWLDHRVLAEALLAYSVAHGDYPPGAPAALPRLTTPTAFTPRLPRDPFQSGRERAYLYRNETDDDSAPPAAWVQFTLLGIGPDGEWSPRHAPLHYDPSNGLRSPGDIINHGPSQVRYPAGLWRAPAMPAPSLAEAPRGKE